MRLPLLYRRRWWLLYLPITAASVLLMVLATLFARPPPPQRVVIGTGPAQSSYLRVARLYAERLERMGIAVDIVAHPRPQDPLQRMAEGDSSIDVTFAQGLYAPTAPQVMALSVIGHEIVWVFTREGIDRIDQLRGQRIAASVPHASNRMAAELVLAHARIAPGEVSFVPAVGDDAVAALAEGRVDAVVHVASGDSNTAATLARLDNVHLLPIERAGALATRVPALRAVVMPQGSIELRSNLPAADLPTMVTLTHLLVRPDLHPALQRALLNVAGELHAMAGFLEGQGQYPSTVGSDFPVSPVALRSRYGKHPWLETLLPYRTAQWAELILFIYLPLGLLTMVLLLRAPRYIEWRVDAALQYFYGELKFLEEDLSRSPPTDPVTHREVLARLDALDRQVAQIDLPDRYADRWYTLREHLNTARERLQSLRQDGGQSLPSEATAP